ncbi:carboxypeptidase-like regulatory domain-containing protein [Paenimyroides ceti]
MKYLYLFLFLLTMVTVNAQTISGIVTDKSTGHPIEDASVFFDNSTTAVYTKSDGSFTIRLPQNNKNSLIVSAFGYEYYVMREPVAQTQLKVALQLEENRMEELVVHKKVFSREQLLKAFRYFFLGNTNNAKNAKIQNEKDLILVFDTDANTLIAYADKPVKVLNTNLGYTVLFHMERFSVRFRERTLDPKKYENSLILGYTQYEDTGNQNEQILKNRLQTYENSSGWFLKNLILPNKHQNPFYLMANGVQIKSEDYFKIEKKEEGVYTLCVLKKARSRKPVVTQKNFINGTFDPSSVKEYTMEEVPFVVMNKKTEKQSLLYFTDECLQINAFGILEKPDALYFGGYFSDMKIADMLPEEYNNKREETDEEKFTEQVLLADEQYQAFEDKVLAYYSSEEYAAYSKCERLFQQKVQTAYTDRDTEAFAKWLETNLEKTTFVNKQEAMTLFGEREMLYKKIADGKAAIEKAENFFAEQYGAENFKEVYYKRVMSKMMQRLSKE